MFDGYDSTALKFILILSELAAAGMGVGDPDRQVLIGLVRTGPNKDDFEWEDSTPFNPSAFHNLDNGEPNNTGKNENCTEVPLQMNSLLEALRDEENYRTGIEANIFICE